MKTRNSLTPLVIIGCLFFAGCAGTPPMPAQSDKYEFKRTNPNGIAWNYPTAATQTNSVLTLNASGAPVFEPKDNFIISDYADLTNKPQINGVTLSGNVSGTNLGLVPLSTVPNIIYGTSGGAQATWPIRLSGTMTGGFVFPVESAIINSLNATITSHTAAANPHPQYASASTVTALSGSINWMRDQVDGLGSDMSALSNDIFELSTAISGSLANKQDTLISGTTIKTINGNSLLGSGNIVISGSGSGLENPARLARAVQYGGITVTDWNDATDAGIAYGADTAAHAPDVGWCYGWVVGIQSDFVTQFVLVANTETLQKRTRTGGVWGNWSVVGAGGGGGNLPVVGADGTGLYYVPDGYVFLGTSANLTNPHGFMVSPFNIAGWTQDSGGFGISADYGFLVHPNGVYIGNSSAVPGGYWGSTAKLFTTTGTRVLVSEGGLPTAETLAYLSDINGAIPTAIDPGEIGEEWNVPPDCHGKVYYLSLTNYDNIHVNVGQYYSGMADGAVFSIIVTNDMGAGGTVIFDGMDMQFIGQVYDTPGTVAGGAFTVNMMSKGVRINFVFDKARSRYFVTGMTY